MRGLPRSERPQSKKLVRVGTLNMGSLTGKSREVADLMKRRNIQVLRLQDTRWKGAKAREIGEGVKLYYNGDTTLLRNGVAIAVAESLKDSVSAVSRISSRIMAVRIDTKDGYWTIISVYAPQAGCPVYEKDEFYLNLDEAIRSVPEGDYLTIAGDMMGTSAVKGGDWKGYMEVGIGVRNEEGERVLDLAMAHDLAVCSTFFAKRRSQKVLPGEELATQHRPLLADIAIELPKKSRTNPEGPIQRTWSKVILGCAKETLGETRDGLRGDKEAWFWNDEVQRVVREKKLAYKRWQKTRALEGLAAYKTSKRLAKASVAKAKNMKVDALHEKLDCREGEKFVFRLAKARHRATQDFGVVVHQEQRGCNPEEAWGEEQFGFMPERSTTDAIFIARQIMEKYLEKRRPCYLAFLDLEKAFDRLSREVLWSARRKRNVPEHLISFVKDIYDGSTTTTRTAHCQTGAIDVTVGVHQGSALSPFLFLLTMDVIIAELVDGPLKTILCW
ncbi:hypothetical protein V3C99_002905 [Haemonchus contortus]|uniref:Reverse transcriptase domain-containing protein n=1 Tax=Haemonchus contortus TaxID=6289 RepID=A0A7I4Y9S5_HAECO